VNRKLRLSIGAASLVTALVLAGGAVYATGLFGGTGTRTTGDLATAANAPNYSAVFSPGGKGSSSAAGPDLPAGTTQVTRTSPREVAAAAAQVIGISERDLVKAVTGGESLIQVAADHGISQQALRDGLIAYENAALAKALSSGRLTERQSEVAARLFRADIDRFLAAGANKPKQ
jgi:hypothetical protein